MPDTIYCVRVSGDIPTTQIANLKSGGDNSPPLFFMGDLQKENDLPRGFNGWMRIMTSSVHSGYICYGTADSKPDESPASSLGQSANSIKRLRNCVRVPEFFGPLSRSIVSRRTFENWSWTLIHRACRQSPRKVQQLVSCFAR